MSELTEAEHRELAHLRASLHGWALGDVKKAAAGGAKLGAFILAAHLIDTLARLARTTSDGKAAWDEFVPVYLERYAGHAGLLYKGYRGATSHHYSAEGIRFTDGDAYRERHWRVEDGDRVLHLESFISDVEAAFDRFYADLLDQRALRERLLGRTRERPLLGIIGGAGSALSASAAWSPTVATHFGSAFLYPEAPTETRMALPKSKKKRRKRKHGR